MAMANLALRFVLELAGVVALGVWGWNVVDTMPLRLVTAVIAAGALIVVWALIVAPKAVNPVRPELRMLIGTALLVVAAAALAATGRTGAAVLLAVLVLVNQALVVVLGRGEA
jgi:hypothetical protein